MFSAGAIKTEVGRLLERKRLELRYQAKYQHLESMIEKIRYRYRLMISFYSLFTVSFWDGIPAYVVKLKNARTKEIGILRNQQSETLRLYRENYLTREYER